MKNRVESRRVLRRKIEGYRDTIARLVDANVEKDKEISELRELLSDLEVSMKDLKAHTACVSLATEVSEEMIRNYRQNYGVFIPETKMDDEPFDDWDGK